MSLSHTLPLVPHLAVLCPPLVHLTLSKPPLPHPNHISLHLNQPYPSLIHLSLASTSSPIYAQPLHCSLTPNFQDSSQVRSISYYLPSQFLPLLSRVTSHTLNALHPYLTSFSPPDIFPTCFFHPSLLHSPFLLPSYPVHFSFPVPMYYSNSCCCSCRCVRASGSTRTYLCDLVAIRLCSDSDDYGVRVGALTRVPVYYINEATK